ncbi:hypothetical protein SESBI_26608 [Sesbania bispinosa]|nr:hypothetical protein SESBI_26608 [Sesbania bispinosa]
MACASATLSPVMPRCIVKRRDRRTLSHVSSDSVSSDCKRKFEDLQPEPTKHRPLESNSNTNDENKRPRLDDNGDDLANPNDGSLKLAIAVSLLRSKLLKNTKESSVLSPSQSKALCRWKQKAKERKQEILSLGEDLKMLRTVMSSLRIFLAKGNSALSIVEMALVADSMTSFTANF